MLLVFTEDIGLVVGDGHVTWSQSPSNTDKQEAGFPYHPFHNRLTNLVNWSPNVQDHITDLFHLGSSYVSTFFTSDPEQYFDEENKSLHLLWIVGSLYSKLFMLPRVLLCVIYSLVEKPD